jgi:hypothetical protein
VFIVKAAWVSLVSEIIPECSNWILVSADQFGKGMGQPFEPEVKAGPDKRKEHEHRNHPPHSGNQTIYMHRNPYRYYLDKGTGAGWSTGRTAQKLEPVIDLNTAKQIELTIPPNVLARRIA